MKKTNRLASATTLIAFAQMAGTSHAIRDDLPTLFDEDTLVYVEIPSIPQLQEDWESNPFYELYQREEVKEFIDGILESLKDEDDSKEGWKGMATVFSDEEDKEIMEGLMTGQIAFGLSRIDFLSMIPDPMAPTGEGASSDPNIPNWWLVFDYDDESLHSLLLEDMEEEEDEYIEYEDFHVILADEIAVAFNEDIVAVTKNEETGIKFIDRYLGTDSQRSLVDNETFQSGFLRLYENSEIYYYIDLTILADLAEGAAKKYEDMTMAMVQQGQLAPSETILEALGLDTFQGISGSVDLDPSVLKSRSLLQVEPNEGFFGKLFGHYGHSLPDTSFLSEDLRQLTVTSFDISSMLHDLEETVSIISPLYGQMYFGQKAQFEQTLSIDIDQAFTDNFSGSLYVAAGETPNTAAAGMAQDLPGMESYFDQGSSFIIGINDRLALEALIDSLLGNFDQMGMIDKQDYLGISNYAMKTPEPSPGPAVFISDQHIIFEQTNPDFAKLVVSMMQNPENPLFERRDIRDALNELPPDPIAITYTDAEKLMAFISKLFKGVTSQILGGPNATEVDEDNPFASLEFPVIDNFKYFTLTTNYKQDDNMYQEAILRTKSE